LPKPSVRQSRPTIPRPCILLRRKGKGNSSWEPPLHSPNWSHRVPLALSASSCSGSRLAPSLAAPRQLGECSNIFKSRPV
jgi:hypothetical protein